MPTSKRLRDDELQELRDVYRGNVSAVYAFFTYSVDAGTAEDLTAATFERVVRSWRRYDARRATVRTWVLVIARNILTDHFAGRATAAARRSMSTPRWSRRRLRTRTRPSGVPASRR